MDLRKMFEQFSEPYLPCPFCREPVRASAVACRHCNHEFFSCCECGGLIGTPSLKCCPVCYMEFDETCGPERETAQYFHDKAVEHARYLVVAAKEKAERLEKERLYAEWLKEHPEEPK